MAFIGFSWLFKHQHLGFYWLFAELVPWLFLAFAASNLGFCWLLPTGELKIRTARNAGKTPDSRRHRHSRAFTGISGLFTHPNARKCRENARGWRHVPAKRPKHTGFASSTDIDRRSPTFPHFCGPARPTFPNLFARRSELFPTSARGDAGRASNEGEGAEPSTFVDIRQHS